MPSTSASSGCEAADHVAGADASRSSSGLRLIWMRPLLIVVLVPSTPMNEDRLSTAGSLQDHLGQRLLAAWPWPRRTRPAAPRRCPGSRRVLHREEALGDDDVQQDRQAPAWPRRPAASRSGAAAPHCSVLAVERDHRCRRPAREARYSRPCCVSGLWRSSRAHIIGVSVSETMADTTIVTLERDGELAEQPAHDVAHEQQRNQHRDQRDAQRHDREADLLRALSAASSGGRPPRCSG